jgi:hypothetical protein
MSRRDLTPTWEELDQRAGRRSWFCHQFIHHPIMWKVNCCKKRHRIVFTPKGRLLFLDHPTSAAWKQVKTLEALHRQRNTGYACRCNEVRELWRTFFIHSAYTHSRSGGRSFHGKLSSLPNSSGVSFHSGVPRLQDELLSCTSSAKVEQLISLGKFDNPETGSPLIQEKSAWSMQQLAWELVLFHHCRNKVKGADWNHEDVVLAKYERQRKHRADLVYNRRRTRRDVYNKLSLSNNLFLSGIRQLSTANIPGFTFLSANPRHVRTYREDSRLSIEAVFLKLIYNKYNVVDDSHMVWVWASYNEESSLWEITEEDGTIHRENRE